MFSLSRLHCFIAVAEELHFGRAAERLRMTQPPLSRQIQQLEAELGVQLVDRTSRSVALTAAGSAFLPEARRIVHLSESAVLTVRRVPSGDVGSVTIGFTGASAHAVLPRLLEKSKEQLPDVTVVLREMVSSAQVDGLASGDLDLGLIRPDVTRVGIESRPIHHERLIAALPKGHPLAIADHVAIEDYDDQPVIMYSPVDARYFNELLISTFTIAGVSPRYVQYVTQVNTMLVLVRSGLGIALVPESAASMHPKGIMFKPVTAVRDRPVQLAAAWRSDNRNPALARMLNDVLPQRKWI